MRGEEYYPPPAGQRAWDWFWELDKARQVGMEPNAMSWSDIEGWMRVTGASPELWELNAMQMMGVYRINPDYNPVPVKEEPVSIIKELKRIQDARRANGYD